MRTDDGALDIEACPQLTRWAPYFLAATATLGLITGIVASL